MDVRYAGVAHVSFSVPDLNRSKRWYAGLFRWQAVMTGEDADSGLDHAALAVASPEELSGWEQRLAATFSW